MDIRSNGLLLSLAIVTILAGSEGYAADPTRVFHTGKASDSAPTALLRSAAFEGNLAEIHRFLNQGADVNGRDEDGYTPLIWAQLGDRPAAVELLLDRGADVNLPDRDGYTALHQAAMGGRDEVVAVLLARGAKVDSRSRNGWTPLTDAAAYGQAGSVELLLAKGADPNASSKHGHTAFSIADRKGHQHIAMLLVANGADPELQTRGLKGALAKMSSGHGGPERLRLAVHLRNPEVLESFCHDCRPLGSDVPLKAISGQAAALNARLATMCQQRRNEEVRGALVSGGISGNRTGIERGALFGKQASLNNAEVALRESIETWERIQAQYPDAHKRLREFAQKGVLAEKLSKVEPLLSKAVGAWQSLQREHPELAAKLLNLAGIGR